MILNKNTFFLPIVIIFGLSICCNSLSEGNHDARKEWLSFLKREPIPESALRLELLDSLPKKGSLQKDYHLADPSQLRLGFANDIFITDLREHAVFRLDPSGRISQKIGRYGQGPSDFSQPQYIGIDNNRNLYVFDGGSQKVKIFNSTGDYLRSFRIYKPCYSMEVDKEGLIYMDLYDNESRSPLINVFDSRGQELGQLGSRLEATTPGSFNNVDICASEGGLFVVWKTFPIVRKYSKSGKLIFEHHLAFEIMKELGNANRLAARSNRTIKFWNVISGIKALADSYYLLRTYPRLEVLNIDFTGRILKIYWDETPHDFIASDFHVYMEDNEIRILVLERYPEPRIRVYGAGSKGLIRRTNYKEVIQ